MHASFCAINPTRSRDGVCSGVFGGGLVRPNYEVFGILSSGSACGGQGDAAIYTDVFLHREWIINVLNIGVKDTFYFPFEFSILLIYFNLL